MLTAVPPAMVPAFAVGVPRSGCARSPKSARWSAETIRAASATAECPAAGSLPCPARPRTTISTISEPRSATPTRSSLGSGTTAASACTSPAATSASVPARPPVSSSATRWKTTFAGGTIPASRQARIPSSAAAIPPFMSQAPRP